MSDLRLTIRKGESRNLLDSRHYSYSLEAVQKSAESGSIHAKSNVIKVREVRPQPVMKSGIYVAKYGRLSPGLRHKVEIVIPMYEELDVDIKEVQEKFAAAEADIVEDDIKPALPVDIKYSKNRGDE